jgi:hypothetical protein
MAAAPRRFLDVDMGASVDAFVTLIRNEPAPTDLGVAVAEHTATVEQLD